MIGKLILTRIEPCFTANKPACGEAARVKKNTPKQPTQQNTQITGDTFTSSKNVDTEKRNASKVNKESKYSHKDN